MANRGQLTQNRGMFVAGDRVQLTGPKEKRHTITLVPGEVFHTRHGIIPHNDIIGCFEGSVVTSAQDIPYLALRPMLRDFVMSMPRGAAIVYPKDAAQIVNQADIYPGATVVEAGVGSGALALSLLNAVGEQGKLISFERREEFADIARANIETYHQALPNNWELVLGDLSEVLLTTVDKYEVDRIVLDMLAPWECLESISYALRPGGVILAYLATVTQLSRFAEALRDTEEYTEPEANETMLRGWHLDGLAVRPDHRMVAHTGFLISARKLAPGTVLPERKKPLSKESFSEEDLKIWTPDALGLSQKSDRRLKKIVQGANRMRNNTLRDQETDSPD